MIGIEKSVKEDENGQLSASDVEAQRWVAGLTFTGLLMTMLVIAGAYAATTPRDIDQACFQAKIADEHALLEAAFQTPPEQDAMVEARRACSH
ncbi:hypothetical protein [Paraburkholderia metrosideri]|jgi:hypothetical protein|uniref:Uncharacterized protein n=1 Tax=Paraburkholderia metrosideri TaxID=580937 RepID=A0ABM8P7Q5_9BURK|nr:hypothetical protein [Paraburkholderia metrosideri]CAD6558575.1 hypothetical protein LMG28140_06417 [Paraburkholderia metrosideri]